MKKKIGLLVFMVLLASLLLSGCFPGDGSSSADNVAGFFFGVWHGWIAPVSLIYSWFNNDINIYEVFNNGFRYNLGFYMAIISGFGGIAVFRKSRK